MHSRRRQKRLCLLDCYSLALEVPKAVSAKCVGLKRATEEASVFFSLSPSSILLYCKRSALENITLSAAAVSLFPTRKGAVTVSLKEAKAQKERPGKL